MSSFRPYDLDQPYLLPLNLREWLPAKHLALFVNDVIDEMDLTAILRTYQRVDRRGNAAYHPAMMVKLLVYGYCTGRFSSRKIEKACWEDVPFRVLSGNQQPDHDSIADFRKRHLQALSKLFIQVLNLCQQAGLVKLGHVAVDGSKMKANASKHKAMSYDRLVKSEEELKKQVEALLKEAERVDAEEDALYGKGNRGDELPEELRTREGRLKKIREAKAALEAEARAKAEAEAANARKRIEERERQESETGKKIGGHPPKVPDPEKAVPEPKAQKNFTDPESRIMLDGATKSFQQSYNVQAAVDDANQIIVAAAVTQDATDNHQLVEVLTQVKENTGRLPEVVTADNGSMSPAALTDESIKGTDLYIAPGRERSVTTNAEISTVMSHAPRDASKPASPLDEMRAKVRSEAGRAIYKRRKAVVEPVFGQIKQARGFRQFLLRGLEKVTAEWNLVALTHNLLKLFRSGWTAKLA
jgi:transposase